MKNLYRAAVSLLALLCVGACAAKVAKNTKKNEVTMNKTKPYICVSMEEGLKMMAEADNFVLLDVRRPDEYKAGHIPGAQLLTNETMTKEAAEAMIPEKDTAVFVYCRSGRRSKEAAQKLVGYGYTNVMEIGGIINYTGKIEK